MEDKEIMEDGDYCPECGHYTVHNVGTYLRCENCGAEMEDGDYCPECGHYTVHDVGTYLRCKNCGAEWDYDEYYGDEEEERDDVHPSCSYDDIEFINEHDNAYNDGDSMFSWHFEDNDDDMAKYCFEKFEKEHGNEFKNRDEMFRLLGLVYAYYDYRKRAWGYGDRKPKYNDIEDYIEDATSLLKDISGEEENTDENMLESYREMDLSHCSPDGFTIDHDRSYQWNDLRNAYPFTYNPMDGVNIGRATSMHQNNGSLRQFYCDGHINGRIFLSNEEYNNANIFSLWTNKTLNGEQAVTNERIKLIFEELQNHFSNLRNWNTIFGENNEHWVMCDIDKRQDGNQKSQEEMSSLEARNRELSDRRGNMIGAQYHNLKYPYGESKAKEKIIENVVNRFIDSIISEEIHIKKKNRGKFNALKKRTGHSTSWFLQNGTKHQKQMAQFAANAQEWDKG